MVQEKVISIGDLQIDFDAYRLLRDQEPIRLTRTEWAIFRELVQHKNQVLSHNTLLQRVWGAGYDDENDYVHTYISRLRRKIEMNSNDPQYIITEQGLGYRFQADGNIQAAEKSFDSSPVKTINPLPQKIDGRFIGRETEQEQLLNLIEERARLISLYGRAGVGKTALACKVLAQLQEPDATPHIDGMVFLSAASTGIGMARIFSDFSRLLALPDENTTDLTQRITALLEQLSRGTYILLLDNLESVQSNDTGELLDADLQTFFKLAIEQSDALCIIITSRETLLMPRSTRIWERKITLDEGLSTMDSASLLRQCDIDGEAGLRDAGDEILQTIAEYARGYPRALEAIVGMLVEDPFLTPNNLLDETFLTSTSEEISAMLIEQTYQRLDETAQRLMQIIAAFRAPVTLGDLQEIARPYLPEGTNLRQVVQRLVHTYCLHYEAETQRITIHPLDRDYCYDQIPQQDTANPPYTRPELHRAIANLHPTQQIADSLEENVEIYLNKFNHLVRADEYENAAELLLWMDETYLAPRNFNADVFNMYERVVPFLPETGLWRACLLRQGEASRRMAQINYSAYCFETVLQKAREAKNARHLAQALNGMGWAQYDLGHIRLAIDFWQRAFDVFEHLKMMVQMADCIGGIGWGQYLLGDYEAALQNFDRAEKLSAESGDDLIRTVNLGDKGVIYIAQGEYQQAISVLNESLNLADTLSAAREGSFQGGYLATAYLLNNQLEEADQIARMTRSLGGSLANEPTIHALHGVILARMGQIEKAIETFEEAVTQADKVLDMTLGLYRVRYARGLANAGLTLLRDEFTFDVTAMDYSIGMAVCGEKGVIHTNKQLMEALMVIDGDQLRPIYEMLMQG